MASGGNFFEFNTRIADFCNSKTIQQELTLADDMNFFAVSEKGEAHGAIGDGAVAVKFHVGRQREWRWGWVRKWLPRADPIGFIR